MAGLEGYWSRISGFLHGTGGSLKTQTLRSGFWVGISSAGNNILSFARSIVLARILAPDVFGLMAICLIIVRGLELFTETGYNAALIHRQDGYDEAKDTAFTLLVLRGFVLAAVTALAAPLLAAFYAIDVLDSLIKVMAISFIFCGFHNINTVRYQKNLNFKVITYMETLQNVANTAFVIFLAYYLQSVWALVIGHVVAAFMGMAISYLLIPGRPRLRFDAKIARELVGYGKYITGLTIVVFLSIEGGNFIIGKIAGMEALGYYVIAFTLANLPTSHFSKIISRVIFPVYSKLQNDLPLLRQTYTKVLKLVSKFAIPAAFGLAALSDEIIGTVYGQKWMPAADVLKILAVFGCIRAVSSLNGYVYNAIGTPRITFYTNIARLALTAVLIYPLTLAFGISGAAWTITLAIVLEFIIGTLKLSSSIGLPLIEVAKVLSTNVLLSLVMAAVIIAAKGVLGAGLLSLAFLVVLGASVFAVLNLRELSALLGRRSPA